VPSGGNAPDSARAGDLVDRLVQLADDDPDLLLFVELLDGVNESARLTAAQLRDRAAALGSTLRERGLGPGDVVLLMATPPCEFLVGLLGCMWAGVIAAPVAYPRRAEHLQSRLAIVRDDAAAAAIVAAPPQGAAEESILPLMTRDVLPVVLTTTPPRGPLIEPAAERQVAYLQYTSGSTRDPKGVILRHDNLMANLEVCRVLMDFQPGSINVSWCPLTHDMGLIMGALPSIAFGMTSVVMLPSAFIRRPMTWLQALDRYRGTHGCSPNFGYDLCVDRTTAQLRAALDLSSVRVLINGAEPVRRRTRDRFVAAFAASGLDPNAHAPAYGLAESSVLVSTTPPDSPGLVFWVDGTALERDEVVFCAPTDPGARELCGDGRLGPGYDARIVDPISGAELPPGQVGELWLAGPSVCPGYWRRPDASEETFGGTLPSSPARYLRTGDLAFLHGDELVICGRRKDVIVIHGRNLYPQDIEFTAELAHPAVHSGGSAAFSVEHDGEEVLVVVAEVVGEPDEAEVSHAIRARVLDEFELRVHDVLLVAPYTVPKTSSGKKQRSATRTLWQRARGQEPALV
jgi:acyl-CoA synthetase (AMP-forming)/AMP-acid ligase II